MSNLSLDDSDDAELHPLKGRRLEPEVMDTADDARDYDAMDHREVNRVFVDDFLTAAAPCWPAAGIHGAAWFEALDVGTGTAQIPVALCNAADAPENAVGLAPIRILAVDLAGHMLELARLNIEVAGLRDRIMLDQADAAELPYADGRFGAVISNSIVHHSPAPKLLLREALRLAAPGGIVFFRDLLRPANEGSLRRLVETYAAGCNDHQRELFDASLRAALTLEEMQQLVTALGQRATTVKQTSDRHWTWIVRM